MRTFTTILCVSVFVAMTQGAAAQPVDDEAHFAWLPRKVEPAPPPAPPRDPAPVGAAIAEAPAKVKRAARKAWYARAWTAVVSVVR